MLHEKCVHKWEKRLGLTSSELVWLTGHYMITLPNEASALPKKAILAISEIFYKEVEMMGSKWPGYGAFYENGLFTCDKVLSNCELNGESFPCCSSGEEKSFVIGVDKCYAIDVSIFL